jgi:hypothetical protein
MWISSALVHAQQEQIETWNGKDKPHKRRSNNDKRFE